MDKWQTCFTQMIQAEEKPLCLFVLQFNLCYSCP